MGAALFAAAAAAPGVPILARLLAGLLVGLLGVGTGTAAVAQVAGAHRGRIEVVMVQRPKGRQLVGCGVRGLLRRALLVLVLVWILLVAAAAVAGSHVQVPLLAYYVVQGTDRTRLTPHPHSSPGSAVEALLVPTAPSRSTGRITNYWRRTSRIYGVTTTGDACGGGCKGSGSAGGGGDCGADYFTFGRARRCLRESEAASLAAGPREEASASRMTVAGCRVATKKCATSCLCRCRRTAVDGRRGDRGLGTLGEGALLHQLGAGRAVDTPVVLVQSPHVRSIRRVDPQLEIRVVGGGRVVVEVGMLASVGWLLRTGILRVALLLFRLW